MKHKTAIWSANLADVVRINKESTEYKTKNIPVFPVDDGSEGHSFIQPTLHLRSHLVGNRECFVCGLRVGEASVMKFNQITNVNHPHSG